MSVRNCKNCGKIFLYTENPICHNCVAEEINIFKKVSRFILMNNDATLEKIERETSVPKSKILKYIRSGKLETTPGIVSELKCKKCGSQIRIGNYCNGCAFKIKKVLGNKSGR